MAVPILVLNQMDSPRRPELGNPAWRRLVIAEGRSTCAVLQALLTQVNHKNEFLIIDGGGVSELRLTIPSVAKRVAERKLHSVGVFRDAESIGVSDACRSVAGILARTHWPQAAEGDRLGSLLVPGTLREGSGAAKIGVYVFASQTGSGMLEDLLLESISSSHSACIDQYFECTGTLPRNISKARCLAYLSATAEKNFHDDVGNAVRAGRFNLEHPCFEPVKRFLRELDT